MPRTQPPLQAPETLRITLLGGFHVSVGEHPIAANSWRLRKARTLVKLLALTPGHHLHREQLWDQLWPEMDPESAANNLHRTLHAARHALQPAQAAASAATPWLVLHGDLLRLGPRELVWVDVEAFEAAAQAALAHNEPAALRAALDLYRGELLPEDRYEDWAAPPREALRLVKLDVLRTLATTDEAHGEHDRAAQSWQQVLAGEPTDEMAHRALMRLYARTGQRQRALHQYDTLRQVLASELGVEPDAQSTKLWQEIRDGRLTPMLEAPGVSSAALRVAGNLGQGADTAMTLPTGPTVDATNGRTPSERDVPSSVARNVHAPLSGTVTFFFSDLAGSTRLLRRLDAARYSAALDRQRELVRAAFAAHHGHEMDTQGDSFFAVFPTANDAVAAALAVQRALAAEAWPEGGEVRVRIGLHTGAPLVAGDHYVGLDVVLAARIMAVGHGGQTLLSAATSALVAHHLPDGARLRDLGEHRLKDFDRPEQLYQLDADDLPPDFAPLKSLGTTGIPRHNLPAQLTSFIGREREVAELTRLLATTRLLTLAGPGGAGKTRLSLAVADKLLDDYSDGVWTVELAGLGDPRLVPQAVAAALGVPEQAGRSLTETLTTYLASRRVLLLLDNCEHLIVAAAQLAEALLRGCRDVRILATSREPLHIGGELIWRVPSLSLPDPSAPPDLTALGGFEAVRLFVERARAIKPTFALEERNAAAVARLCHRLDGMPLALELAAARVGMLTVEQIVARLDDSIALLTGGTRTALTRQQTLRAALDWSHALLDESERAVLRRLAVFAGGFTLEAAEAVVADDERVEPAAVLDLLAQLVDKSLVVAEAQEDAQEARYRLLEPIRQYAHAQLRDVGELAVTHRRHWAWCLDLARRADTAWRGAEHQLWLARIEGEHDNLRAALGWCVREDPIAGLELAGRMWQFWLLRGYLQEGRQWLEALLAAAPEDSGIRGEAQLSLVALAIRQVGPTPATMDLARHTVATFRARGHALGSAHALYTFASISYILSDMTQMRDLLAESLTLAEAAGYAAGSASIIHAQGFLAWHSGEWTLARTLLEESVARFRAIEHLPDLSFHLLNPASWTVSGHGQGHLARLEISEETLLIWRRLPPRVAIGYVLATAGSYARLEGDYARAHACLEEGLACLEAVSDKSGMAQIFIQLGHLARCEGDYPQARLFMERSLALRLALGERRGIGSSLGNIAFLATVEGDHPRAHALLEESEALFREMEDQPFLHALLYNKAYLAACEGNYPQAQVLYEQMREWQGRVWHVRPHTMMNLGTVARLRGDRAAACGYFAEALAIFRANGNRRVSAQLLADLGELAAEEGDIVTARTHFAESLALARDVDDPRTLAIGLAGVAGLVARPRPERAVWLAGAAVSLDSGCQDALEPMVAVARARLGGDTFAAAWDNGQALGIERAVTLALALCEEGEANAESEVMPPAAARVRRRPRTPGKI